MLEDILWRMVQQSRVLQELRREIQPVWDDNAAREVDNRYLNPHAGDDERLLEQLHLQDESLDQSAMQLTAAQEDDQRAAEQAVVAMEQLRFANQDLQGAYGHYDVYARYHVAARGKFPQVQSLIREANASCD